MNFNYEKFGIMMRVFGISNCDKCREAKKWLTKNEIDFEFIDFRKQALTAEDIKRWIKSVGEEKLINKRGTTWRALPEKLKQNFEKFDVVNIMLEKPTVMKRPIFETQERIIVGFSSDVMNQLSRSKLILRCEVTHRE